LMKCRCFLGCCHMGQNKRTGKKERAGGGVALGLEQSERRALDSAGHNRIKEKHYLVFLSDISMMYQTKLNFEAKQINRVHSLNVYSESSPSSRPRDSEESSPTPQFKRINSSVVPGLSSGFPYFLQFKSKFVHLGAPLVAQLVKNLPAVQETRVRCLGQSMVEVMKIMAPPSTGPMHALLRSVPRPRSRPPPTLASAGDSWKIKLKSKPLQSVHVDHFLLINAIRSVFLRSFICSSDSSVPWWSFLMSQLFKSHGQNTGTSAPAPLILCSLGAKRIDINREEYAEETIFMAFVLPSILVSNSSLSGLFNNKYVCSHICFNQHSQIVKLSLKVEEEKKHKSSEVEVSDNVCDAADERGLIEQRRSGGNSNQEFPAMQNEDSYSDPGVPRKDVKKENNGKWTPGGCVIAPVFEKTDSLTGGLLHVNDDSILREVDQSGDRPARITPHEKKKVKEQINYVNNLDDLTQSSETVSEDDDMLYSTISTLQVEPLDVGCKDFGSLLKIGDAVFSYERLVGFQRSHCELLRGKIYKMKSKVRGLQNELSETKEVKSQLEHQKVEWERELSSLRFVLKQEEEKRRNTNMSYEKIREQLRRVEEEHSKEIEMKQQLEISLRALEMELKTVRNSWNQIMKFIAAANHLMVSKKSSLNFTLFTISASDGHEEAKDLLCKNHILQEEIASLRLEIDAVKSQNLEEEKNYFEDIEIVKAKSDDAQKAVKLTEEMLTKTVSQDTGQPNVLAVENTMLKSKLENKKESKQRLETEVKSYHSKLAAASHDHDRGQTSPRDLKLAFQRAKDEWLCLQDKMESDVANLKDNSKALSQQLSTVERKFNKLKIKLQRTRDDLREKTLTLERVQRDLHQAEYQKQETEHMYQNEQGKVNEHLGKQESLEERLSQLQSENMLLRQQLDDVQNKADSKEKTVIGIQDQFQQIVRKLHAESEKQGLMLEERNKELISERNHLKERLCQYENRKAEREVNVRQLLQELADTVKKQSMSEASLEVMSHYCANLDDETQDLKNNFRQLTSQVLTKDYKNEAFFYCCCSEKCMDHLLFQQEVLSLKLMQKKCEKKLERRKKVGARCKFETYKHLYLVEFEVRNSLQDELDKERSLVGPLSLHGERHASPSKTYTEYGIPFTVWQLTKCKSLREAGMKSVLSIFPRTNERLAEISTKLEVEKQQNRSLLSTHSSMPVLEPSSVGNFKPTSGFNANLISRANVGPCYRQSQPVFPLGFLPSQKSNLRTCFSCAVTTGLQTLHPKSETCPRGRRPTRRQQRLDPRPRGGLPTADPSSWCCGHLRLFKEEIGNQMRRELDKSITREVRKVEAELASDAFQVSSRRSSDGSNVHDDQLLKAKKDK
ncbi:hypothetical protein FD755_015021, partial [Muntiacus reevesi]